ncbi:hypothetical protein HMPREF7215_1504 [Pyramidobacter piscolens W5455]|uniref:Uncharacterized protein n=1 Tax=Pyramidobacter piscolens W5455 TaxID=352165 RepID=A0ABP2HS22_9BACT|nr:hypothetical protein HMPREF7215_1504 [Pyramidobacter piscolens W5455]
MLSFSLRNPPAQKLFYKVRILRNNGLMIIKLYPCHNMRCTSNTSEIKK